MPLPRTTWVREQEIAYRARVAGVPAELPKIGRAHV